MRPESFADLWSLHAQGWYLVDPTNLTLNATGAAVMGAGISRAVAERYPQVPAELGRWISTYTAGAAEPICGRALSVAEVKGHLVFLDRAHRIVYLPTKYDWRASADLALIDRALGEVSTLLRAHHELTLALPRIGAGLGGRDWADEILPLVRRHLETPEFAERVLLVRPPAR
jgi:O-acetyl-ADP-ribose deacetylase (regulator of RNase III)